MSVTFSLKDALLPQDVIDIVEFFYNNEKFKQFEDKILLGNMLNKIDELPDEEKENIKDQLKRVGEKLKHNYLSAHYNYQFQRKWDIKSVRVSTKEERKQGYLFQQALIPQEIKVLFGQPRNELAKTGATSIERLNFPPLLKEKIKEYAKTHKNFSTYDVLFAFDLSEIDDELLNNFICTFKVQNNHVLVVPVKKIEEQLQIPTKPQIKSTHLAPQPIRVDVPKQEAVMLSSSDRTLQERCIQGERIFTQHQELSLMTKYFIQMKTLVREVEKEAKDKKAFVKELEEIAKAFYEQWGEKDLKVKQQNQNLKEIFVNLHVDVLKQINALTETLTTEDMQKTMNISSLRKFSLYKQAPSSLSNKETIDKLCRDEIKKLESKGTPSYKALISSYKALQSLIQELSAPQRKLEDIKTTWEEKFEDLTVSLLKESEKFPHTQEEGATLLTVLNEINTKFHDEILKQLTTKPSA